MSANFFFMNILKSKFYKKKKINWEAISFASRKALLILVFFSFKISAENQLISVQFDFLFQFTHIVEIRTSQQNMYMNCKKWLL